MPLDGQPCGSVDKPPACPPAPQDPPQQRSTHVLPTPVNLTCYRQAIAASKVVAGPPAASRPRGVPSEAVDDDFSRSDEVKATVGGILLPIAATGCVATAGQAEPGLAASRSR